MGNEAQKGERHRSGGTEVGSGPRYLDFHVLLMFTIEEITHLPPDLILLSPFVLYSLIQRGANMQDRDSK